MPKRIHLSAFMLHAPAPHTPLSWIYPSKDKPHEWYEPGFWRDVASVLERGRFDMLFLADTLGGGSTPDEIRYAIQFPCHDPVALATYLSGCASKLGFAVTMSTTFYPPYLLARTLATLDHLTQGRIGWNVVSSYADVEARNFGRESIPQHDARYDLADEYMAACNAMWSSWDDDAVVMDNDNQIFADPAKVHRVGFSGDHYQVEGPFTVIPSGRRPFLFQAGQSDRGRQFAARHGEGIFSAARGVRQMREFSDDLANRLDAVGRDPNDVPIFWAAQPIVADSADEAHERFAEITEQVPVAAKLAQMSAHWDLDLSRYNLDQPVAEFDVGGVRGLFEMYRKRDPNITLRQIAATYMTGGDKNPFVGTPSDVADAMDAILDGGGGNGFLMSPPYYAPHYYQHLVDKLIPELVRRGRYPTQYDHLRLSERLRS